MSIVLRANEALSLNPASGVAETLSLNGSNWLWAVTGIYLLSFIVLLTFCFTTPESDRVFHYLFTVALLVGAVTYYAEASDLGWSAIGQQPAPLDPDQVSGRQLFYAKYINWAISFPSVALALGLLSGVSWTTIFTNISISWLWVLTYLAAAYVDSSYKWGFFAFGTLAWLILAMSTLNESREAAALLGIGRHYIVLAGWANLLWLLYPAAFGLSDGSRMLGVTGGFIFFGILDVLLVPVLSFAFLVLGRKWDYERLNLAFSDHRGGLDLEESTKIKTAPVAGDNALAP
ncbi:hypothetical protein SLS62_002343 [Diatrype stigma]|uniref:Family A G protein-coupled receptor-like protein n=1 Tax=Diatrype stigma TaxID=117547 RepID=A0AAN9UUS5_9PEZI